MSEKKEGKSGNGFLFGALLGGGLTYLLVTEKGRTILKDLFHEGMNAINDMTDAPVPAEETEDLTYEPVLEVDVKKSEDETNGEKSQEKKEELPKKHFFKPKKN